MDDIAREIKKREFEVMSQLFGDTEFTKLELECVFSIQCHCQKQQYKLATKLEENAITMDEYTTGLVDLFTTTYRKTERVIGTKRTNLYMGGTLAETLEVVVPTPN